MVGNSGEEFYVAVVKCLSMGSSGELGSRMETLRLLLTARDQGWQPEAVFVVGYCRHDNGDGKGGGDTDVGTVCVSSDIIQYNKGKLRMRRN